MSIRACFLALMALSVGWLLLASSRAAVAGPPTFVVYNFEGFSDGTAMTTQYPGLTFSNTIIAKSGVSLNELEAPPHSGLNVVEDMGGPISIQFAAPIIGFGGYFNYAVSLTLTAFNAAGQQVGSATSLFSNDFALSGDSGSTPNEFLQVLYPAGFSSVTITGDPNGGSFTLDDATVTSPAPVPEASPRVSMALLLLLGIVGAARSRRLPARRSRP